MATLIRENGEILAVRPPGPGWTPEDVSDVVGTPTEYTLVDHGPITYQVASGPGGMNWRASAFLGVVAHGRVLILPPGESVPPEEDGP